MEFVTDVSVFGIDRYKALTVGVRQDANLYLQLMQIQQGVFDFGSALETPTASSDMVHLSQSLQILAETQEPDNNFSFDNLTFFMYDGWMIRKDLNVTARDLDIRRNAHVIAVYPFKLGKDFEYSSGLNLTLFVLDRVENVIFAANVKLKVEMEVRHLKRKLEKHMQVQLENFAFIHDGIMLSDRDTLEGAGFRKDDKIVLMHVELETKNPHLERLLIVNAACRSDVTTNNEPAVGEPFGMRIIHNLDPHNLSGHESKRSAEVCKSLLKRIPSTLVKDLEWHVYTSNDLIHFVFQSSYVHASDLLFDLFETLISHKTKCEKNSSRKKVLKEKLQMVTDFYDESDPIFKTTCGKYFEPLKRESFFSYENVPSFATIPKDRTFIETVLYVGPLRDGNPRHNLPLVKLRGITWTTTIQDVINSYKVYAKLTSHSISAITVTFNNKTANPTKKLCDVLRGLFEKNYIMISDLALDDIDGLDNILEFIEGKKDEKVSKRKKKKKTKNETNNADENETPLHQNLEPTKDVEKSKIASFQAHEVNSATSKETGLVNKQKLRGNLLTTNLEENNDERHMLEAILKNETDLLDEIKSNLENLIGVKSKEMKNLLVEISIVEDQNVVKDKKMTSIDVEIEDLEARVSKLKAEKLFIEKENDLDKVTVQKLNNKKERLESYIKAEMEITQSKEREIKRKIKKTKEKMKALVIMDTKAVVGEIEAPEQNEENCAKQKLLDFLTNSIEEKENDLECPVCLEIASIPIYSCQESHLICSACRPKVMECPECRIEYRDNEVLRRHRYAEKTASELERLKEERNKIL